MHNLNHTRKSFLPSSWALGIQLQGSLYKEGIILSDVASSGTTLGITTENGKTTRLFYRASLIYIVRQPTKPCNEQIDCSFASSLGPVSTEKVMRKGEEKGCQQQRIKELTAFIDWIIST